MLVGEVLPHLDCRDAFTLEVDQSAPDFRAAESAPQLEFGSGDGEPVRNDWFDLEHLAARSTGSRCPSPRSSPNWPSGATHMLLPNGVYFRLDTPELVRLRELIDEARALGEIEGDRVNAGSHNVTLWEELLALGVVDEQAGRLARRAWRG